MRQRWLRVGILAGVLFALNIVARLVVRVWFPEDFAAQDRLALATFGAVGLVLAVMAFIWGRSRPQGRVIGDLAAAAVIAGLLSILVGPLVGGVNPFAEGVGGFISQVWLYAAFAAGGGLIGFLVLIMLGRDYKSRSLQRYADSRLKGPTRPRPHPHSRRS